MQGGLQLRLTDKQLELLAKGTTETAKKLGYPMKKKRRRRH
ncbi:hypothetical protein [Paenibacillus sp. Y412MC10]|nr:hypothetical protein [Paenibacillus sp. Y412MC10]